MARLAAHQIPFVPFDNPASPALGGLLVPTKSTLHRVLATAVLAAMALNLAGCSLLFTSAPPSNYKELNSFSCTESEAAPILDVVGAALNLLGAVAIAGNKEAYENPDQAVAVGLAWTAALSGSAVFGFSNAKKCREARTEAGNRNALIPATTAQPLTVGGPALVEITPAVDTLHVGERVQLQATAQESSGALLPGLTYTWSSSNDAIASVNVAGNVFANAVGSVVIAARTGAVVGTAKIVVVH